MRRLFLLRQLQQCEEQLLHRVRNRSRRQPRHRLPIPRLPSSEAIRLRQTFTKERRQIRCRISSELRFPCERCPAHEKAQSLRRMRKELAQSFTARHAHESLPCGECFLTERMETQRCGERRLRLLRLAKRKINLSQTTPSNRRVCSKARRLPCQIDFLRSMGKSLLKGICSLLEPSHRREDHALFRIKVGNLRKGFQRPVR